MAEKKHAVLSASGSERWINCPGSIKLSENAPPQRESEYAHEGTRAHECFEKIVRAHPKKPYITRDSLYGIYPIEMVDHAFEAYKEVVKDLAEGDTLLCETQVRLDHIEPGMFGTVDSGVVKLFDTLIVWDFKYGQGVVVDPKDNTQLLYYALALAHQYDYNFEKVRMGIIQPRAEHSQGTTRTWEIPIQELRAWGVYLRTAVDATRVPNPKLKAGDHCRWCPAAPICPEISKKSLTEAQVEFSAADNKTGHLVALPVPNLIPLPKLSNTLLAIEKLETWITAVKSYALQVAESGGKIPQYKLVQKRSIRRWSDPEVAKRTFKNYLGPEAFTEPDLLSPAQMEKTVNRILAPKSPRRVEIMEAITNSVTDVSSGVTLVHESDRREEYDTIKNDFESVPQQKPVKKISKPKTKKR